MSEFIKKKYHSNARNVIKNLVLKSNLKIHLGEKLYKCINCHKAFLKKFLEYPETLNFNLLSFWMPP